MKTFIKILAVSALLIALCQAATVKTDVQIATEAKLACKTDANKISQNTIAACETTATKTALETKETCAKDAATKDACTTKAATKAAATKATCATGAAATVTATKAACAKAVTVKLACAAKANKRADKTKATCAKDAAKIATESKASCASDAACTTKNAKTATATKATCASNAAVQVVKRTDACAEAASKKLACNKTTATKAACAKAELAREKAFLSGEEACDALGMGVITATPHCEVAPILGKCQKGFHKVDEKCVPNTSYCSFKKYDPVDYNCTSCKWYAFEVQNDAQSKSGTKNGNYCETRWWWITLYVALGFIGLLLVVALIAFACRKSKNSKEQRQPLVNVNKSRGSRSNEMVEVHQARPAHYEPREVRHEPREVRYETREVRHVETSPRHQSQVRTSYSPNRSHQD